MEPRIGQRIDARGEGVGPAVAAIAAVSQGFPVENQQVEAPIGVMRPLKAFEVGEGRRILGKKALHERAPGGRG